MIEKINLEEYVGFIGEPEKYQHPMNYNLKRVEDKINEIIDKLNEEEKCDDSTQL